MLLLPPFFSFHSHQKQRQSKPHYFRILCECVCLGQRIKPKYKQVIKPLQIIPLSVNKSHVSVAFHLSFHIWELNCSWFFCCSRIKFLFHKHQPHGIDKFQIHHCLFNGLPFAFFRLVFFSLFLFNNMVCLFDKHFWELVWISDGSLSKGKTFTLMIISKFTLFLLNASVNSCLVCETVMENENPTKNPKKNCNQNSNRFSQRKYNR